MTRAGRLRSMRARLRTAAATGASVTRLSSALGVNPRLIKRWAAEDGIVLPDRVSSLRKSMADPAVQDRLMAIRLGIDVQVPAWVPRDLAGEYLEVAAESGEEAAASLMRRLKREMLAGVAA